MMTTRYVRTHARHRLLFALLLVLSLLPVSSELAARQLSPGSREVTECDRLAAHPLDRLRVAEGVPIDQLNADKALSACRTALEADPSNPRLQLQLGRGMEKAGRLAEARQWYAKAAQAGYANAQTNLAWVYYLGKGTTPDYEEARKWAGMAAKSGHTQGMILIAQSHAEGKGTKKDPLMAIEWYEKAATHGDVFAMTTLGDIYVNENRLLKNQVSRDNKKAIQYFAMAAERGDAEGLFSMGWVYEYAVGIPQDLVKAKSYYEQAAAKGSVKASNRLIGFAKLEAAERSTTRRRESASSDPRCMTLKRAYDSAVHDVQRSAIGDKLQAYGCAY